MKEIYLAGGNVQEYQKYFSYIDGIAVIEVGYINNIGSITKEAVKETSGHVEAIHLIYDSDFISLEQILDLYFYQIDPMYKESSIRRNGIYYTDVADKKIVEKVIFNIQSAYVKKVQVECEEMKSFNIMSKEQQAQLRKHSFLDSKRWSSKVCEHARRKNKENVLTRINKKQYNVLYGMETEEAFDNLYWNHFEKGIYVDVLSKEPLFLSRDKINSMSGWPTFSKTISKTLKKHWYIDHWKIKREVKTKDRHHLGHIFYQNLIGTKKRYCINSASLKFIPEAQMRIEGYGSYLELLKK